MFKEQGALQRCCSKICNGVMLQTITVTGTFYLEQVIMKNSMQSCFNYENVVLSRAPMRNVVARVRGEGGRRQLGKVGDGRAEGGREGGRERGDDGGEEELRRREEKEGKEGKVQNARILAKRCRSGGGDN